MYKYIKEAIIRAAIPFVIMAIIAFVLFRIGKPESEYLGTLYSAIIVAIVSGATVIYEYDVWSTLKKTIVHFIVMLLTVFPILVLSGWFPNNTITDILFILFIFLCVGLVSWLIGFTISYLISRNKK